MEVSIPKTFTQDMPSPEVYKVTRFEMTAAIN